MPWQLSYAALADADNAELQTDVMRFMAILAFCLVAIFAIVQSLPATANDAARDGNPASAPAVVETPRPELTAPVTTVPAQVETPVPAAQQARVAAPSPRTVPGQPIRLVRPEPAARARPQVPAPIVHRARVAQPVPQRVPQLQRAVPATKRAPQPVPELQRAVPVTPRASQRAPESQSAVPSGPRASLPPPEPDRPVIADPTPAPPGPGLSLRFESDAVLRGLVRRGVVALYAIDSGTFHAMSVGGDGIRFVAAAAPAQYHEMYAGTVPPEVARSYTGQRGGTVGEITWGVTLPPSTSSQLMRFVRTRYSGELVITADAGLALAGG